MINPLKLIRAQYQRDDKSIIKYWLPYGMMVRNTFARYGYREWNGVALDIPGTKRPFFSGLIRRMLPYGFVLGLDQRKAGITVIPSREVTKKPSAMMMQQANAMQIVVLKREVEILKLQLEELRSQLREQGDRVEILALGNETTGR